jgi:hypothetical protein
MASIKEYFDKAFEQVLTAVRRVILQSKDGEQWEAIVQIHYDFDVPGRYISLFIPKSPHWKDVCSALLTDSVFLLSPSGDVNIRLPAGRFVYGGFKVVNAPVVEIEGRPLCEPPIKSTDLPFSGTVFLYSESDTLAQEVEEVKAFALQRGIKVRWRGPEFARERSLIEKPVAFISHDSLDKQDIARPIAIRLQQMICPVWFDEFALNVDDSLREKIEKGLRNAQDAYLFSHRTF